MRAQKRRMGAGMTDIDRIKALEDELREVRQIFKSGAGEILALSDNATKEEMLAVLKRFAKRLLSVGKRA